MRLAARGCIRSPSSPSPGVRHPERHCSLKTWLLLLQFSSIVIKKTALQSGYANRAHRLLRDSRAQFGMPARGNQIERTPLARCTRWKTSFAMTREPDDINGSCVCVNELVLNLLNRFIIFKPAAPA